MQDDDAQEHPDQGQQKTGQAQAQESHRRQDMVAGGILVRGRVDADGKRDDDHKEQGQEPQQERKAQVLADHIPDRGVPAQGIAKVQAGPAGDPAPVLDVQRLIQAIDLLEFFDHLFVLAAAGFGNLGLERGKVIARRQLDDDKGDHRHNEQHRDHDRDAPQDISQHTRYPSTLGLSERGACRPSAWGSTWADSRPLRYLRLLRHAASAAPSSSAMGPGCQGS